MLPPQRSTNVNKVSGACALHDNFHREPLRSYTRQGEFPLSLFHDRLSFTFPLYLSVGRPWRPFLHDLTVADRLRRTPPIVFFPLQKEGTLPFGLPLRSVAREVRPLLTSPLRSRAIHGAVMATPMLMGLDAREATPMHDGEANDQYLNPRDTLFHSVTLACPPTMLPDASTFSVYRTRIPLADARRFCAASRVEHRREKPTNSPPPPPRGFSWRAPRQILRVDQRDCTSLSFLDEIPRKGFDSSTRRDGLTPF